MVVNFSIFDAIANENDFVFDERDCKKLQVQQHTTKSYHELTAQRQTKQIEHPFSIYDNLCAPAAAQLLDVI